MLLLAVSISLYLTVDNNNMLAYIVRHNYALGSLDAWPGMVGLRILLSPWELSLPIQLPPRWETV